MTRNRAAFIAATTTLSLLSVWQHIAFATPQAADKPGRPIDKIGRPLDAPGKTKDTLPTQAALASKTAKFSIAPAAEIKGAIDAHDLAKAKTLEGKPIVVTGTVTKVFAPKSNKLVILNFDKDYKSAVTAVVFAKEFAKFPDLKTLEGKKVVVMGTVKPYQGEEEIALDAVDQVKLVK